MVVYIFIYIKSMESVQHMSKFKVMRYELWARNTHKVGPTQNGIQVDDGHGMIASSVKVWLDHPHPSVQTWGLSNSWEPRNEGARIFHPVMGDRKERTYTSHIQALKPRQIWISFYKNTVIPCQSPSPWANSTNPLSKHPSKARFVTGCIINRDGGGEHTDITLELWAISKRNVVQWNIGFRVFLLVKKSRN